MTAITKSGKHLIILFIYALVPFGSYLVGKYNYLLFHTLAEFFSIVVAYGIFIVAWNSRQYLENHFLLFIGIAYLFVGSLDLVHTLAYKGMGIFPDHDANLPTQIWIATRYVEGISMLIAPIFLNKRSNIPALFILYSLAGTLILLSIFTDVFPACFIEGKGLTLFKKTSEFIISLIFCGFIAVLITKRDRIDESVLKLMCSSVLVTICSELCFTLYGDPYGLFNQLGHLLKILSFQLIYTALIVRGLRKPYDTLFMELKRREQELKDVRRRLEVRVRERTAELVESNMRLEQQIDERTRAEERLLRYRQNLEDLVKQRTHELTRRNIELKKEIEEREHTDQALIKQKEELQVVFDSVPALICYKDMENHLIRVNKNWLEGMGFSEYDVIGKSLYDVFPHDQADQSFTDDQDVILSGEPKTGIIEVLETRTGPRWFSTDKVPFKDERGNILGVIGFSRDITENQRAENLLILNQARLTALLELNEMAGVSQEKIIAFTVEKAVALTKSKIGFVGYTDAVEKKVRGHIWSENAMDRSAITNQTVDFDIKAGGLWAEAVRRCEPVIINDYDSASPFEKGDPAGHVRIHRFLAVPVVERDRVVALAATGNKNSAYDDDDVHQLKLLMEGMWHIVERGRVEKEFDLFFNLSLDMLCVTDLAGRFKRVNPAFVKTLGYTEQEFLTTPLLNFIHPDDHAASISKMRGLAASRPIVDFEIRYRCKNGLYRWLAWTAVPAPSVNLSYAVARDITERKNTEARIRTALKEKEAMLSEIHHRVKNNMQVISSLLNLQSRHAGKKSSDEVFCDCRNRIQSMALIHEALYQSGRFAGIDFGEYVGTLVRDLIRSFGMDTSRIRMDTDVQNVFLNIDKAVPCGLIINELVSNSIKYAFPGERKGRIHVGIYPMNDKFAINVKDDGIGLPEDFSLNNDNTLGIKLVEILVEQLDGTLDIDGNSGTNVHVVF